MNQELYDLFLARERKISEGKTFLDARTGEDGKVSAADASAFSSITNEVDKMTNEIDRRMSQPTSQPIYMQPGNPNPFTTNTETRAHRGGGVAGGEYKDAFLTQLRNGFRTAQNFLQEGQQALGGYTVPQEMHNEIITALEDENVFRKIGNVIQTSSERRIAVQATRPAAAWKREGEAITFGDVNFASKTIGAYKCAAAVDISNELLFDSFYDLETWITAEFAKSIAAAEENAFLNGSGIDEPAGLIPALDSSATITTAGTSIAADDIINLVYKLKRPYRKNAAFVLNDTTLAAVRKLKDSTGNFLWTPSLTDAEPDRLLGVPCYTSAYAPEISTGAIVALFGDFSRYLIGQRGGLTMRRLDELHAANDMTGFVMIERVDAVLADSAAVVGLKMK